MKQLMSSFLPHDEAQACTSTKCSTQDASSSSDLEARIDYQALLLHTAATLDERRCAWSELTRLHAMRSPQRVTAMEREAGLAR